MNKTFPFEAHINGVNEKRLRYFYTVMMLGSIRQAADLLDIEQSAISRQIQLFESELKVKLFERKGRSVVPTEAAYVVLEYFKEHQARENELFDKLFQLKTTQMGKVNVVSSEGYITQLVYDVLHHVHAKYASLEIHLELLNVNQIVRQVSDGMAHIGLAYNPPVHADLEVVAQKTEPLMLAVPASHPLTQLKRPVNLNELQAYKMGIMPVGYGFRQLLDSELVKSQCVLGNIGLTTNYIAALKNYVISGHGIAVMRHADIHEAVEAGLASTLKLDSHLFNSAKTRLMVRKNSDISESTHLLIEKIQTSFGLS